MNKDEKKRFEALEKRLKVIEDWTVFAFEKHFKQFRETGEVKKW